MAKGILDRKPGPWRENYGRVLDENKRLKELIRIQSLGMLALVDGFDGDLLEAIQKGAKISYEVKGVSTDETKRTMGGNQENAQGN